MHHTLALLGSFLHAQFFLGVFAYLRVFRARVGVSGKGPHRPVPPLSTPFAWFLHVFKPLFISTDLVPLPKEADVQALLLKRRGRESSLLPTTDAKSEPPLILQCDENGELLRCHRDQCGGRWKPPRARHCGDCKTCRVGFDHHCPWVSTSDVGLTQHAGLGSDLSSPLAPSSMPMSSHARQCLPSCSSSCSPSRS